MARRWWTHTADGGGEFEQRADEPDVQRTDGDCVRGPDVRGHERGADRERVANPLLVYFVLT